MDNFTKWIRSAEYTPTGEVFDVGTTCLRAINKYNKTKENPTSCGLSIFNENGNGSLMRILPIIIYCYYNKYNDEESYKLIKDISSLTHAHEISIMGCYIYYLYIKYLFEGLDKYEAYNKIK